MAHFWLRLFPATQIVFMIFVHCAMCSCNHLEFYHVQNNAWLALNYFAVILACVVSFSKSPLLLAWPPLQSLAVNKKLFLCEFWAVKNFFILLKSVGEIFLSGLRGAKNFSNAFRIVFRILFRVFQTVFRIDLKVFRGQFRSADMPP